MQRIVEYIILRNNDYLNLSTDVNTFVGRGWQPFGGLVIRQDGVYFQAMVKYADATP